MLSISKATFTTNRPSKRSSETFSVAVRDRSVRCTLSERYLRLLPFAEAKQKAAILSWVQSKVPQIPVSSLSSCWTDGVLLCALIDALRPGSCPQFSALKASQRVYNCRLGLRLAQHYLKVPQVRGPRFRKSHCWGYPNPFSAGHDHSRRDVVRQQRSEDVRLALGCAASIRIRGRSGGVGLELRAGRFGEQSAERLLRQGSWPDVGHRRSREQVSVR